MKLVASLMCRNEMNRFLPLAVNHLLSFCDSIAVLDDASDDGSAEWLAEQDRVVLLRRSQPGFFEHEGRTRQQLYEFTLKQRPTHILSIDCDEFIGEPETLREACRSADPVHSLGLSEVWAADLRFIYLRMDGLWKERRIPILFRPERGWKIRDRKLACGREPEEVARMFPRARRTGATVYHMGWLNEHTREERYNRYATHDQGNYHARAHLQSIMWDKRRVRLLTRKWPESLVPIRDDILRLAASIPSSA